MSFVLQFFPAPEVRTIAQADAFFARKLPSEEANRARFTAFREDILRTFPDNSEEDTNEVDNVWPEGWADKLDGDAVLVVQVATDFVDENLMRHIGHAAARAGLHLLNPQDGCLCRADGTSFDMNVTEQAIGSP